MNKLKTIKKLALKPKLQTQILKPTFIEILILTYRFRYLTRNQIQTLLSHKTFNRIIIWLNQLTDKKYLKKYDDKKDPTKPNLYSLGTEGRKYFLENKDSENQELKNIQLHLLDRVWKEQSYSIPFRNHCLFLTDIYISLLSLVKKNNAVLKFHSKTDLTGMQYLIREEPDAFFSITEKNGLSKRYFLDIFDPYPKYKYLLKRVKQYSYYYSKSYWQDNNKSPFPEIVFVCYDYKTKNNLNKIIQKELENQEELIFYLTTWGEVRHQGMTRQTLHKVEIE